VQPSPSISFQLPPAPVLSHPSAGLTPPSPTLDIESVGGLSNPLPPVSQPSIFQATGATSSVIQQPQLDRQAPGSRQQVPPVTLNTLRADPRVPGRVQEHLQQIGVEGPDSQIDDSEVSGLKGKKPVSGRLAKITDSVTRTVWWPHSLLDPKFVVNNPPYEALDFPLLVAGELSRALDHRTSSEEARFRIALVRELSYCARVCKWPIPRQFHAAILLDVERDTRKWTDINFTELTTSILAASQAAQYTSVKASSDSQWSGANNSSRIQRRRGGVQDSSAAQHYFCRDFNQGVCAQSSDHKGELKSRNGSVRIVTLEHICGACWLSTGEVNRHPETNGCARYKPKM
jgi:hypothetical protein